MFASTTLDTMVIASMLATILVSSIAQAAPHAAGGRIDSTSKPGVARPTVVKYHPGRVDPGHTVGVYEHDGRKVDNGRQG